ncbi:sugar-binding transcriptional regulator [Clostridium estertheticum]|uniref:RNA polymerase subunit sigma-70 n=2 Tax=Clostridium estertheticum TaxID=238834 RepID=A0A1J0GFM4_9CLOT|nr:sugar-binding transcriptional regulator [Clostridium estertheticum]APC40180.1 RNA polymerase subunit sigma-70 [Clostridium estertheticum subsp. estertheticum]MBU3072298.1 sugar-binding transcriptional regulator [Clostridium estertheticum]MBU3162391.1 sugar-binding transcriptional regulator [Clostridium estertheticum]MBU3170407.1 sugar-binding transcriptional regulator [Clostridium estertheticum]MBU3187846.1 sugar-binding transcriptional regulator [Clostridium estertheticum]
MDSEKQQLSVEVARLYYQSDYSQQQIALQLGISRPTISRLLQYAKIKGYVKISIIDPFDDLDKLAYELKEKYELNDVHVVFSPRDDYVSSREYISKEAAEYLQGTIKNGDIIGVSWGTTMYEVAKRLMPQSVKGIEVVQLKGGISHSDVNTYASETIALFAEAFKTVPRYLPLPVIFDNAIVKQMVEEDRHIKSTMEMGIQANVAIFTVGTVRDGALLFRLGYLNEKEKKILMEKSVGDICSRFFDENGEICDEQINNRTIGISIDELKQKEKSILVAGGKLKLKAIKGALKAKSANILITDQYTAKRLLE